MSNTRFQTVVSLDDLDHLAIDIALTDDFLPLTSVCISIQNENGSSVVLITKRPKDLQLLIEKLMEAKTRLEIAKSSKKESIPHEG